MGVAAMKWKRRGNRSKVGGKPHLIVATVEGTRHGSRGPDRSLTVTVLFEALRIGVDRKEKQIPRDVRDDRNGFGSGGVSQRQFWRSMARCRRLSKRRGFVEMNLDAARRSACATSPVTVLFEALRIGSIVKKSRSLATFGMTGIGFGSGGVSQRQFWRSMARCRRLSKRRGYVEMNLDAARRSACATSPVTVLFEALRIGVDRKEKQIPRDVRDDRDWIWFRRRVAETVLAFNGALPTSLQAKRIRRDESRRRTQECVRHVAGHGSVEALRIG